MWREENIQCISHWFLGGFFFKDFWLSFAVLGFRLLCNVVYLFLYVCVVAICVLRCCVVFSDVVIPGRARFRRERC